MAKKFNSVWRLLLGSLIILLGFGSCKTSKNIQQPEDDVVLYGPPPASIEKQPIDHIRLLYGVPPVRMEKIPEE